MMEEKCAKLEERFEKEKKENIENLKLSEVVMVTLKRNSQTFEIDYNVVIYVLMTSQSTKMNDGWCNTKKNLKDFLNEQLSTLGIKVEKPHRLGNRNDGSP